MAAIPVDTTTGQEVKAVQLFADDNGAIVKIGTPASGSTDGASASTRTFWTFPMVFNGTSWDRVRRAILFINIPNQAITAGTPVTIVTPTSGKKFRIHAYHLSLSVAGMVLLKYGAGSTEFLRTAALLAGAGQPSPDMGQGLMPGAANDVLKIDASASGNVNGWIAYNEE